MLTTESIPPHCLPKEKMSSKSPIIGDIHYNQNWPLSPLNPLPLPGWGGGIYIDWCIRPNKKKYLVSVTLSQIFRGRRAGFFFNFYSFFNFLIVFLGGMGAVFPPFQRLDTIKMWHSTYFPNVCVSVIFTYCQNGGELMALHFQY
jgi:hypothetical protein